MAQCHPPALTELIERLAKLPGLGPKSAAKLALFFLRQPEEQVRGLAQALVKVKENIKFCSLCHNFTDQDPCPLCADPRRNQSLICVVETPGDLMALEAAGIFRGRYHVLGGALSPLNGVGPDDLRIQELLDRLEPEGIAEVLLATGGSPEGESTALYLADRLKARALRVTRIARGVPVGVDLEYVDEATLKQAFDNRREA